MVSKTDPLCGKHINVSCKITKSERFNAEENVSIPSPVVNKLNAFVAKSYVVSTVSQKKLALLKDSLVWKAAMLDSLND